MRRTFVITGLVLLIATISCSAAATSSITDLPPLTTPSDLMATVDQVTHEAGFGPNGHYDQYDLFVTLPPGIQTNAGLVLGSSAAVFFSASSGPIAVSARTVRPGDVLEVWVESGPAYGSVQAPPAAPAYTVRQAIVHRQ